VWELQSRNTCQKGKFQAHNARTQPDWLMFTILFGIRRYSPHRWEMLQYFPHNNSQIPAHLVTSCSGFWDRFTHFRADLWAYSFHIFSKGMVPALIIKKARVLSGTFFQVTKASQLFSGMNVTSDPAFEPWYWTDYLLRYKGLYF